MVGADLAVASVRALELLSDLFVATGGRYDNSRAIAHSAPRVWHFGGSSQCWPGGSTGALIKFKKISTLVSVVIHVESL